MRFVGGGVFLASVELSKQNRNRLLGLGSQVRNGSDGVGPHLFVIIVEGREQGRERRLGGSAQMRKLVGGFPSDRQILRSQLVGKLIDGWRGIAGQCCGGQRTRRQPDGEFP